MSQITLRQIPEALEKQLRGLAEKKQTSLNKTIISLLMEKFGISADTNKKRDLTDLSGTWNEEQYRDFINNSECFNNIDPEMWD